MFNLKNSTFNLSPVKLNVIEYEKNKSSAYSSNIAGVFSFCFLPSLHHVCLWPNSCSVWPLQT